MQVGFTTLLKICKRIRNLILNPVYQFFTWMLLYGNNVKFTTFKTSGVPFVSVSKSGNLSIGNNFRMNNRMASNPIGRTQKCSFFVGRGGYINIGNNVSMSFTAINCKYKITIQDNVMIGGGTCIYDSDFHPLNALQRINNNNDDIRIAEVTINKNAFIGANVTILKGVTIGENAVIGACAVVTKSIPPNEIWAGNPAKFIKSL